MLRLNIKLLKGLTKTIIRVDGNSETGLGHIYRGIALAEMLKKQFDVEFLTKSNSSVSPILNSGFICKYIPDEIELNNEPEYFTTVFSKDTIIVIDGYYFDQEYQSKIKQSHFKLVYIDDLQTGKQQADLVINHSPSATIDDYNYEDYTKFALGFNYSLLRQNFLNLYNAKGDQTNNSSVFVSFGGADKFDLTLKTVLSLCKIGIIKKINIVLGKAYTHEKIHQLQSTSKKSINIYQNIDDKAMLELMEKSNLAISPASTTLMELLAVGIPTISGYFVENQKKSYLYLNQKKYIVGVGDFMRIDTDHLKQAILECDKMKRIKHIDGKQTERIIQLFNSL